MPGIARRIFVSASALVIIATAQQIASAQDPYFTPGNLVVVVEGCGVHGGTCDSVANGTGTGAGNSTAGGYGDNQAAPLTLFQYAPSGTSSAAYVNALIFPQAAANANFPVSAEYGSSSEGTLQLSGAGQYLTVMGYGIDAPTFDAAYAPGFTTDPYGAAPSGALAQSGSLTGQPYTAIPRVITLIDPYGNVNSATALYNIFDTNNPRSIFTADGVTAAYVSGQGTGCDATGGVFYVPLGAPNTTPTAITGLDASGGNSSCPTETTVAQDTRTVQIYNGTLYISVDSTEGKSDNRSMIGTLGTPPTTSLFTPPLPQGSGYTTGPAQISGLGNNGGTGKQTITTGASSNGNPLNNSTTKVNKAALDAINMSPSNYFFASPSVLYIADTGNPKNDSNGDNNSSGTTNIGDGGLQKWVNSSADGTGTWSLKYTLYQGLNLVNNGSASGTTGLYGLTGVVSGGSVFLYATNATIGDLDSSFLYGITDTLANTTPPGTSLAFTQLDSAPPDSNFKGVALAPTLPPGSATITSAPSGLAVTTAGTGCIAGTYTTPVTLIWTPGNGCTLSVVSPQGPAGTQYTLTQWQDGTTGTSDSVTAPATSAVYSATFSTSYLLTTSATTGGTVSAGGYIAAGSDVQVSATANTGFYFVNFTGTTASTSNPLTLTMSGPQSITANFAPQVAPTVTFTGAPSIAPEFSTFMVSATTNSGATPTITASGACSISGTTVTINEPSGACTLTATWPAQGSFLGATLTQSTTAEPPAPAITWATPAAITYGAALSGAQLDATASFNGEKVAGTFTYTPAKGSVLGAGTQTLSVLFTPNNSANFSAVTAAVTLQVNQATPKVTWNKPAAIVYGTVLSDSQLDATASAAGTFAYSPVAGTVLTGGTQTLSVTFTPTDTTDYTQQTATVNINVTKATPDLSWTAPASVSYGTPLGATQLDATATIPGTLTYSPAAGTVLAGGTRTLSVTFAPTDTTDYTTAKASVSILVTASTPTIDWATPAAITYGTALTGAQLDAQATLNGTNVGGTYTYTPAKGTVLGAGTQTLNVVFTPSNTSDYNSASGSVTLQVNPVAPKITWLKPGAIEFGTPLSSVQLDATAAVPGTFVYSPDDGTVLSEGTQTLSVTFTPTDTIDYTQNTATTTINVKP
jgi:Divergent InlB B-repeat domain